MMVPSDYRLDYVVARLIERLEGTRPSFRGNTEGFAATVERIARDHVNAAMDEAQELAPDRDTERQRKLLEEEVVRTFVPRYLRLAATFNDAEEGGYGFGVLSTPPGRLGLVVVALLIGWFVLLKLIYLPVVWPLILLDLSLPFWPDIGLLLYRRRHQRELEAIVDDMARIQDQALAYLPPEQLDVKSRESQLER